MMKNESFVVFHADELDYADSDVANAVNSLTALPNVKVDNLLRWYQATYGDDSTGIKGFKGYFCKVGALLAAPYDIVSVIDLNVVLLTNPFLLMESETFQRYGHYLFRDRRTSPSKTTKGYIGELKKIWAQLHPDRPLKTSLWRSQIARLFQAGVMITEKVPWFWWTKIEMLMSWTSLSKLLAVALLRTSKHMLTAIRNPIGRPWPWRIVSLV